MSAVALPALTRAALKGFPIAVTALAGVGGGRGLVATRAVEAGEVVLSEKPLVATPPPGAAAACAACLAPVAGSDEETQLLPHCSPACAADLAASGWAGAVAGARGFSELTGLTAATREKFAWLAARAAVRHVAAALKLPGVDVAAATAAAAALRSLVRARVTHPLPPGWVDTHAAFSAGAERWLSASMSSTDATAALRELVPVDGWGALLATAHVNAVRVDVPPPLATHDDFAAALDALATGAVTTAGAGSALYAAASMANHSCVPSVAPLVNVAAPAQLTLVATRALAPGDAVTLAYVDDDAPLAVRRAALEEGYGFLCECQRCLEESDEK